MTTLQESEELSDKLRERDAFIAGLRQLADWLVATPAAPIPWALGVEAFGAKKDVLVKLATAGGPFEKRYFGNYFELVRKFDGRVKYIASAERDEVCERVVTGQREVEVPAVEAAPAKTVVEDVVEWKCHPLLGG